MIIKLCNKDVSKGKEDGYGCKFLHATGHQCSLITRSITFFEHQALTYALILGRVKSYSVNLCINSIHQDSVVILNTKCIITKYSDM